MVLYDIPQATGFHVLAQAAGNVATIDSFAGLAAPGKTIAGYLVTPSLLKPLASAFAAAKPETFAYPGLTPGKPVTKAVYGWVMDSNGQVSLSKQATVRFGNP